MSIRTATHSCRKGLDGGGGTLPLHRLIRILAVWIGAVFCCALEALAEQGSAAAPDAESRRRPAGPV